EPLPQNQLRDDEAACLSERTDHARKDPHPRRSPNPNVFQMLALSQAPEQPRERQPHAEKCYGAERLAKNRNPEQRREDRRKGGDHRSSPRPKNEERTEVVIVTENEADQTARSKQAHLCGGRPGRPRG